MHIDGFLGWKSKIGLRIYTKFNIHISTSSVSANKMSADKIELNISPKCTTVLCVSTANKSVNHQKHTKLNMKIDTASLYAN